MWVRSVGKVYQNVSKAAVWQAWADVNNWPSWDDELAYCELNGDFKAGNSFLLKPKKGPKVKIHLTEVVPGVSFSDCTHFPGAKMHDIHYLEETSEGLRVANKITVTGLLGFLWVRLVVRGISESIEKQMDQLVNYARGLENA